jgi:hypothetical protein
MPQAAPANQVYVFSVTAPANTPASAPVTVATTFPTGDVVGLEVVIAAGHSGLTGIYLTTGGGRAIPINKSAWITGDDEKLTYDLVDYLDSGAWAAVVYNVDVFDHTWQVRYLVHDPRKAPLAVEPPPIPTALIA